MTLSEGSSALARIMSAYKWCPTNVAIDGKVIHISRWKNSMSRQTLGMSTICIVGVNVTMSCLTVESHKRIDMRLEWSNDLDKAINMIWFAMIIRSLGSVTRQSTRNLSKTAAKTGLGMRLMFISWIKGAGRCYDSYCCHRSFNGCSMSMSLDSSMSDPYSRMKDWSFQKQTSLAISSRKT